MRPATRARVRRRAVAPALALLAAMLATMLARPRTAGAHDPFEITTDAHIRDAELQLHTTLSLLTAGRVCLPGEYARQPLLPAAFPAVRARLEACARDFYRLTTAGAPLPARTVRLTLTVEDDLDMKVAYARPTRSPLLFDAVYLRRLTQPSAGVILTVTGERAFLGQQVLRPEEPTLQVSLEPDGVGGPGGSPSSTPSAPRPSPSPSFTPFLALGVRHILSGYDHLLFLLGLLIACRSLRAVLGVVTCFTVAHSITLALAALNVVTLPSRVVEPLIAATIVFVGLENLRHARAGADRVTGPDAGPGAAWAPTRLAFLFGLLHGFAFSMALRETGLGASGAPILLPLLGFNLGVELGQIAVAGVALPILWRLRRIPLFARHGATTLSILISGAGLFWLVQRIW